MTAFTPDKYWHAIDQPHRHALIDILRELAPFDSLLEVGSNCGPNLRLIHDAFPDADLTGLDLFGIDFGAEQFAQMDRAGQLAGNGRVAFVEGPLPDSLVAMQPVDVVLSCYTLAYVGPEDIAEAIFGLFRLAQRAVVIAEPMVTPHLREGRIRKDPDEYRHNYVRFYRDVVRAHLPAWQEAVAMRSLEVDRMNRVLIARRTP